VTKAAAVLLSALVVACNSYETENGIVWEARDYSVSQIAEQLPFIYYGIDTIDTGLTVHRRWLRGGIDDQATPDAIIGAFPTGTRTLKQLPWPCCQSMTEYAENERPVIALFTSNVYVPEGFPASKYFSGLVSKEQISITVNNLGIDAELWKPSLLATNRGKRGLSFRHNDIEFGMIWSEEDLVLSKVTQFANEIRPEDK
jgi:hypothetical protein